MIRQTLLISSLAASFLAFFVAVAPSTAFVILSSPPCRRPSVSLLAKKRRRKSPEEESLSDLPDFDLDDGSTEDALAAPKKTADSSEISSAMMGSSDAPVRSVRELIADRALESKFEFEDDDINGEALPDLPAVAPLGKKKSRQQVRKAAAEAAKQEAEDSFLNKIPFIVEDGEVKPLKVLEAGTWLGIFILIAWEIYLNSPLFERAAPMAPIVYQFYL